MRVLVACEFSGVVRDAFIRRGHDAWSCDLLPCENEGPHMQGDVRNVLSDFWDLMVAHPPCTYLSAMGIWWNAKRPERWPLTLDALEFVKLLAAAPIAKIAIENPIGYLNRHWRKPDCIVNPWQFGHEAHKPTCLWLKRLPPLMHSKESDLIFQKTHVGRGRFYTKANGTRMSVWSHVTSGTRKADRARIASRTFQGIADAMAQQWGAQ